jgi:hypothetical protein
LLYLNVNTCPHLNGGTVMSLRSWIQHRAPVLVLTIITMLMLGATDLPGLTSEAKAESVSDDFSHDLRVGQVTYKRNDAIYIDQLAYELHGDVMLKDDEERPRQLKDFETGSEVRFRLKQGRLALLVLILPK